jgi:hypothetical protein
MGQVIRTVEYADFLVLLATNETVLLSMTHRLTEDGGR